MMRIKRKCAIENICFDLNETYLPFKYYVKMPGRFIVEYNVKLPGPKVRAIISKDLSGCAPDQKVIFIIKATTVRF